MPLKRQIGLWTAIALIIGQVVAVGIFLTPAGMAKSVASPFWLLMIWLIVGGMTLSGALCYAELAARYPEAGGSYVYLREAFGRPVAFLYGWMVLLVLDPGLTAVFGVGAAAYLGYVFPLSPIAERIVAVGLIAAVGSINIVGIKLGTGFLKVITIAKISILASLIVYGFAGRFGSYSNFQPFFSTPPDMFGALAGGIVGAFFAFAGWWEVTRLAGEIRDPSRNVPRALVFGVVAITILYLLTSAVFMYLVPLGEVTSDETFAAQAGAMLFGPLGATVLSLTVVISIVGTLFAYLIASPRVYVAMAGDGLFFRQFAHLHPRFGTPYLATLIQMSLAGILVLTGTFNEIVSYFFFVVVAFVGLTVTGLFRIRGKAFDGYSTPLYPWTPVFFLALTVVVLFFVAVRQPLTAAIGVGVTLLGLPIYAIALRGRKNTA